MLLVFRVDASIEIGSGHVMRCLTLADKLSVYGVECHFVCRKLYGNLIAMVSARGYSVHVLANLNKQAVSIQQAAELFHSSWLGCTQENDVEDFERVIATLCPDWIVVDHYALDYRWEQRVQRPGRKILVIDDLADRVHCCDILLDQTFGRQARDYKHLLPENSLILTGSAYALLRDEFSEWRTRSIERRKNTTFNTVLISLGGVDKDNDTAKVLNALSQVAGIQGLKITVVLGATAPHLSALRALVANLPLNVRILMGVKTMAELLSQSDMAIGAAGASSWERCCLGVPTFMLTLAENQKMIAKNLHLSGAAKSTRIAQIPCILSEILKHPEQLKTMSDIASLLTDGLGANRLSSLILERY
jgi:UDP-2,4-diacetamido-2,4,6-trideoxy-beta-L-altropyranose hydrolase